MEAWEGMGNSGSRDGVKQKLRIYVVDCFKLRCINTQSPHELSIYWLSNNLSSG